MLLLFKSRKFQITAYRRHAKLYYSIYFCLLGFGLLSKIIRLLPFAVIIISVGHIPPQACALRVFTLQLKMRFKILICDLAIRIKQAFYHLTYWHIATRIIG